MQPAIVQVAANLSEGRDTALLAEMAAVVRAVPGVLLVDHSWDVDHHRTVLTYLGEPEAAGEAGFRLAEVAVRRLDLRRHQGRHPRIGALDVLPFVPYGGTPIEACRDAARRTGERIGAELGVPVYLYGDASRADPPRQLPDLRRGGFEGLVRLGELAGDRSPDYGPTAVHPSAGATAVGARYPLLAFNVVLASGDLSTARAIAAGIRKEHGSAGVRALGLDLGSRGLTQVSMNLTRPEVFGLWEAYRAVADAAEARGIPVLESELIGCARVRHVTDALGKAIRLTSLREEQILDPWAAVLGAGPVELEEDRQEVARG